MKNVKLWGAVVVTLLLGSVILGSLRTQWMGRQAPAATLTPVYLPFVQDASTPGPTSTSTATSTPMPTSTPYPTVAIGVPGEREGQRPDERPDLSVAVIIVDPSYPTAGEPVLVEVVIANAASAAVPNTLVTLAVDGEPLATQRVDLLPVADTSLRFTWAAGDAGVHTLIAVVDPNQELVERNLADNSLAQDVAVAPPAQGADLTVTGLELDLAPLAASVEAIGPARLRAQVQNNGSSPVEVPVVFTAGTTVLATILAGPLAPGAVTAVEIPVAVAPDSTQFAVEVNPRFRGQESNPADNVKSVDLRPDVDLQIDSLSVAGALVESGLPRQVTVSFRILNVGRDPITQSFRTRIFPGDTQPDPNDDVSFNLAEYILTSEGLPAGASIYAARTVVLPTGVDQFEASVEVDIDNNVDEASENNNVATALYSNPAPNVGRWISIGPRRMTDSGRHGYPWPDSTGRLSAIAIVPNDPNTIYVGAKSSGVWKTTNGGATWRSLTDSLPTLSVAALALDPANANRVFMVSGNDGVFRSSDGGTSWSQISTTNLNAIVHGGKLLISPANSNLLFVVTSAGVQRSTDGGVTWTLVLGGGSATGLVMDPANSSRLYAALYHETSNATAGIYLSTNSGASWSKLQGCPGAGLPAATAKVRITLAMSGNKLFTGYRSSSQFRLFRTLNQTCTVPVPGGTQVEPQWEQGWQTSTDHGVLWSGLYADPTNTQFLYMGGTDFWRSTDGGTTFTRSSGYNTANGSAHADHHAFAVDPANAAIIYSLNDGGIYRSTNRGQPGSWVFIGEGLLNGEFYDHAVSYTEPDLVIGGTQDNGTLIYDGSSTVWKMIAGGDGATVDIDPSDAQVLLAMNQYADSIKRSTNGGASMQGIAAGLPTGAVCFNLHFQVHPTTPTTVLASCSHTCTSSGCQGGLWRTTNPGSPWSVIFSLSSGRVTRSAVDGSVNLYYAGTSNGRLFAGPNGANWQEVFVSPAGAAAVVDIDVDLNDPQRIFLALSRTGNGRIFLLRRASAQPTSMTALDITSDLPTSLRVNSLAVDRMQTFVIFAGTDKGVYRGRSSDNGATWHWTPYTNGMPAVTDIRDLEVHPTTGVLRAATHGRGVYEVNTDDPIGSLLAAEGKLTFLRVHDVGTAYGPPSDRIDGEIIIQLDSLPGRAFGFQLRTDANEFTHKGMLDVLRDAFTHDTRIRVDYIRTGLRNGRILRVMQLP